MTPELRTTDIALKNLKSNVLVDLRRKVRVSSSTTAAYHRGLRESIHRCLYVGGSAAGGCYVHPGRGSFHLRRCHHPQVAAQVSVLSLEPFRCARMNSVAFYVRLRESAFLLFSTDQDMHGVCPRSFPPPSLSLVFSSPFAPVSTSSLKAPCAWS